MKAECHDQPQTINFLVDPYCCTSLFWLWVCKCLGAVVLVLLIAALIFSAGCYSAPIFRTQRLFLIGNFVGVYLKQEVKCVKTKCLGQSAEKTLRDESVFFCSCIFDREREK